MNIYLWIIFALFIIGWGIFKLYKESKTDDEK